MKMLQRSLLLLLATLILLVIVLAVGVFTTPSVQRHSPWGGPPLRHIKAWDRLTSAIQFPTISFNDTVKNKLRDSAAIAFRKQLQEWYPLCFSKGTLQVFAQQSLMLTFKGSDPHLKPAIFLAHMDVVPVDQADLPKWKYPPFEGKLVNDTIWGRGSLDDKLSVLALLESMEFYLQEQPNMKRTVIFAFGCDEETLGTGAASMAKYLKDKGIKAEFILDEGLGVMHGIVPGIAHPTALIGIAEKGFASIEMSVEIPGGHSSTPKKENAIAVLNTALNKINNHPMPAAISEPMKHFFTTAAPEMAFPYRVIFSNLWLTRPLVISVLDKSEKTAASIRTTAVTTMLNAGVMDVVVPNKASAVMNFRIIPGENLDIIMQRMKDIIDDPRVHLRFYGKHYNPTPVAPINGFGYNALIQSIEKTYNNTVIIPSLVIATTDARHYTEISDAIYRFLPARFSNSNISSLHGINECISTHDYDETIGFYTEMLLQCQRN